MGFGRFPEIERGLRFWYSNRIVCYLSAGHEKPGGTGIYADSRLNQGLCKVTQIQKKGFSSKKTKISLYPGGDIFDATWSRHSIQKVYRHPDHKGYGTDLKVFYCLNSARY